MSTAIVLLMVLVFHTAPAFGQMATSTATSTGQIDPLGPSSPFRWVQMAHKNAAAYALLATSSPFQVVRDYLSGATTTVPSVDDITAEADQIQRQRAIDQSQRWNRDYWTNRWQPSCGPRQGTRGAHPNSDFAWKDMRGMYGVACDEIVQSGYSVAQFVLCSNLEVHRGFHLHCTEHLGLTPLSPRLPPTHQRPYNPLDPDDRPYGTGSLCGFLDREDYLGATAFTGRGSIFRVVKDYADGCRDTIPSMAEIAAEAQYWCSTALKHDRFPGHGVDLGPPKLSYAFEPAVYARPFLPRSEARWLARCHIRPPGKGDTTFRHTICAVQHPDNVEDHLSPIGRRYIPSCTDRDRDGSLHSQPYLSLDTSSSRSLSSTSSPQRITIQAPPSAPPYDVSTVAGYREWAIRHAAARCAASAVVSGGNFLYGLDVFEAILEPPGGFPAVTDMSQAKFTWITLAAGVYALTTGCSPDPIFCRAMPPYSRTGYDTEGNTYTEPVGLGMSCAQLGLPPINAPILPAKEYWDWSWGRVSTASLPSGHNWYGQPELPRPPAPRPASRPRPPAPEPEAEAPVGNLEVPGPGSFQSGIGYIRGWVCEGQEVEIYIDDGLRLPATARGLDRADTEDICGDRDNGFILVWNWNLMEDGDYTASLVIDGQTVQRHAFTVTTLGQEYIRGAEKDVVVNDFPSPGESPRLRWQEPVQGFVIVPSSPRPPAPRPPTPELEAGAPVGNLEVPGPNSFQSGIGYIRGWVCEGQEVEIYIDDGLRLPATARGLDRADTEDICGDRDNGFILVWNWNLMGDGDYTASLVVDGQTLQRNAFTVTTLGQEYIRGAEKDVVVNDFPSPGESPRLRWQEPVQGFVIVPAEEAQP